MMLLLSNIEVQGGDYSIDSFLDYLQQTGYYDLIQEIKNSFGDDIAIAVCEELVQSNDCEIVVRIYMITHSPSINGVVPCPDEKILKSVESHCQCKFIDDEKMKYLICLILRYYYSKLLKEMNEQEIFDCICRIIKNTKINKYLLRLENKG